MYINDVNDEKKGNELETRKSGVKRTRFNNTNRWVGWLRFLDS